jgi:predicted RNA-binding Zn-ribbon protein involved in translation (DUF1610 family)
MDKGDERFCIVCGAEMYQDEDVPQIGWSCPECGAIDDEA